TALPPGAAVWLPPPEQPPGPAAVVANAKKSSGVRRFMSRRSAGPARQSMVPCSAHARPLGSAPANGAGVSAGAEAAHGDAELDLAEPPLSEVRRALSCRLSRLSARRRAARRRARRRGSAARPGARRLLRRHARARRRRHGPRLRGKAHALEQQAF